MQTVGIYMEAIVGCSWIGIHQHLVLALYSHALVYLICYCLLFDLPVYKMVFVALAKNGECKLRNLLAMERKKKLSLFFGLVIIRFKLSRVMDAESITVFARRRKICKCSV